eukprot:scaffold1149_cov236-Pinguiococcus_pyrenoidosus.AAC.8
MLALLTGVQGSVDELVQGEGTTRPRAPLLRLVCNGNAQALEAVQLCLEASKDNNRHTTNLGNNQWTFPRKERVGHERVKESIPSFSQTYHPSMSISSVAARPAVASCIEDDCDTALSPGVPSSVLSPAAGLLAFGCARLMLSLRMSCRTPTPTSGTASTRSWRKARSASHPASLSAMLCTSMMRTCGETSVSDPLWQVRSLPRLDRQDTWMSSLASHSSCCP